MLAMILAFATLLLTGAAAGLFFAFSISVMWGLDRAGGPAAIRSMQEINRAILNPVFMVAFMGAPVAGFATSGLMFLGAQVPAAVAFAASASLYVLGVLGVTMVVNVPMNQRLDREPVPSDADAHWRAYSKRWTAWNHLRTIANLASLGLAGAGLWLIR